MRCGGFHPTPTGYRRSTMRMTSDTYGGFSQAVDGAMMVFAILRSPVLVRPACGPTLVPRWPPPLPPSTSHLERSLPSSLASCRQMVVPSAPCARSHRRRGIFGPRTTWFGGHNRPRSCTAARSILTAGTAFGLLASHPGIRRRPFLDGVRGRGEGRKDSHGRRPL
jgi:hypothetical protein